MYLSKKGWTYPFGLSENIYVTTHLHILEEMTNSTHLFRRGWPPIYWYYKEGSPPTHLFFEESIFLSTHLSRIKWPTLPIYLRGDCLLYTCIIRKGNPYPLTFEESIFLSTHQARRRWPATFLSWKRWSPLPTYLEGHLLIYLGGHGTYLLIYGRMSTYPLYLLI